MNNEIRIVQMNIENLKPYENNPRVNNNAVDAVAASIKRLVLKCQLLLI